MLAAVAWVSAISCGSPEATEVASDGRRETGGQVRTYYVAAEEVDWEYAPDGRNQIAGRAFGDDERVFVGQGEDRIGSAYRKVVYRAYTDASFSVAVPSVPDRGILGPVLHGEVGDTLEVVFRNNGTRPYSMHPHGVFYDKESEGAGYAGGDSVGHAVPPGETFKYVWRLPERAGPGPADPSSVVWLYHSHVNSIADTNAGLVGTIVVTRAGEADADGRPADVDQELFSLFTVFDENQSHFLAENIERYTGLSPTSDVTSDDDFIESNLMHAINGYVWGNGPRPLVEIGTRVRWYLLATGTEVDLHTPHWHGNTVLSDSHRVDVVELLPASMKVVDMTADNPGLWLFHCHVNDHIAAGMVGLYEVAAGGRR